MSIDVHGDGTCCRSVAIGQRQIEDPELSGGNELRLTRRGRLYLQPVAPAGSTGRARVFSGRAVSASHVTVSRYENWYRCSFTAFFAAAIQSPGPAALVCIASLADIG